MNFIFISPQFPHIYWQFCNRLKQNGVNVLGVADAPYKSHLASALSHDAHNALSRAWADEYYCVFASRRDIYTYVHSVDEVRQKYGDVLVMCERMPEILSGAMGQQMFTVKVKTKEEKDEFIKYVHER